MSNRADDEHTAGVREIVERVAMAVTTTLPDVTTNAAMREAVAQKAQETGVDFQRALELTLIALACESWKTTGEQTVRRIIRERGNLGEVPSSNELYAMFLDSLARLLPR